MDKYASSQSNFVRHIEPHFFLDDRVLFKMIVAILTTCHTQYTSDSSLCVIYLIEQHSKFLFNNLQVLYMCTLCDSTNINTIIEVVSHFSSDGFSGSYDSYLQFRYTHAPCLLKLCIPPWNGIVEWWLFPEFGAELPLDICTPTIILNNPVRYRLWLEYSQIQTVYSFSWTALVSGVPLVTDCCLFRKWIYIRHKTVGHQ